MTSKEAIKVLDGLYNNPSSSKEVKEAVILAMEAMEHLNQIEQITEGLEISPEETCKNKSDWAFECSNCGAKLDDCKTTIYHKDKVEYPWFNYCPNCGRRIEK